MRPRSISMRMYGRENNEVVSPTKAVRVTRKTLKESMKNCSWSTSRSPSPTTRTVSAHAAANVPKLKSALASAAHRRAPYMPSSTAPVSGIPRRSTNSTLLPLLQRLQIVEVEAVKLLADLEEEHPEHEHRDEHVEGDAELDDHRHAVGGTHRPKEEPVLH